MNKSVDIYIEKLNNWQAELNALRHLVLDCQLTETFKWKQPCYTYQNSNVVTLISFKDFCTLSFFKGALLKDSHNILEKPGPNSQSARYVKFTNTQQIEEKSAILKQYVYEAIEVEKAGLKVEFKKPSDMEFPTELIDAFKTSPELKTAFYNLTPGRQKGYLLHISGAKQSNTKVTRIKNATPRILIGKGIHDCICGKSKRMPRCDGSHKF